MCPNKKKLQTIFKFFVFCPSLIENTRAWRLVLRLQIYIIFMVIRSILSFNVQDAIFIYVLSFSDLTLLYGEKSRDESGNYCKIVIFESVIID